MNGTNAARVPAVVTAGGKLDMSLSARYGSEYKALATLAGQTLLSRVIAPLTDCDRVGPITIVGPVDPLQAFASDRVRIVADTGDGIGNVLAGLRALAAPGDPLCVVSASDVPFLTPGALRVLLDAARPDADLVFPVITKADYLREFPESPNVWTPLADGPLTGGSVVLVRLSAMEKISEIARDAFSSRKSQFAMAKLLGFGLLIRFLTRTLTVARAEARVSRITGLNCQALVGAPPELACDVDTESDFAFVEKLLIARGPVSVLGGVHGGA